MWASGLLPAAFNATKIENLTADPCPLPQRFFPQPDNERVAYLFVNH
jgi:hypothetical protein